MVSWRVQLIIIFLIAIFLGGCSGDDPEAEAELPTKVVILTEAPPTLTEDPEVQIVEPSSSPILPSPSTTSIPTGVATIDPANLPPPSPRPEETELVDSTTMSPQMDLTAVNNTRVAEFADIPSPGKTAFGSVQEGDSISVVSDIVSMSIDGETYNALVDDDGNRIIVLSPGVSDDLVGLPVEIYGQIVVFSEDHPEQLAVQPSSIKVLTTPTPTTPPMIDSHVRTSYEILPFLIPGGQTALSTYDSLVGEVDVEDSQWLTVYGAPESGWTFEFYAANISSIVYYAVSPGGDVERSERVVDESDQMELASLERSQITIDSDAALEQSNIEGGLLKLELTMQEETAVWIVSDAETERVITAVQSSTP